MKRIEVTTTQNVTIEYKAASFFERLLAYIIDIATMLVALGILYLMIMGVFPPQMQKTAAILILSPIYLLYHLIFEIFNNGVSLGKLALSLRVVKLTNEPVSVYDYFMRWAFRLVDIGASSGIVAAIAITSSPRNQRIGDYLADTTVIKVAKTNRFSLNRVVSLDVLKDYEPNFPEITTFSEADMLILKNVVERIQKYPGGSTKEVLEKTISKIESTLGIKAPSRDSNFLKILIKDYVALTR